MPNTLLRLTAFVACWMTLSAGQAFAQVNTVTFHFYGALDCPPCMAFKKQALTKVTNIGRRESFSVAANIIAKTSDVRRIGVYGEADTILRTAAEKLDIVYPPIFFVSRGNDVLSVHGHDWQAALEAARRAARQSPS